MIGGQWCGCFALWFVCLFVGLLVCCSVGQLGCPGWLGALLRAAPVQGVSRPPHTASRDCRNGSPLARAIPCVPAPECGDTRQKETSGTGKPESRQKAGKTMRPRSERQPAFLPAHPHAAQRAVTGWRGGLGRVGADLASAGSMRPPPSPARHVSTAWLATTHLSRETAAPPQKPAEKQPHHHNTSPPVPHSSVRSCHSSGNSTTSNILRR